MPGSPKAVAGEKEIWKLVKLGIMEQVDPQTPNIWTSALHLQPKLDGSLRPCGDYRPLNDITELDGHPLPNIRHFAAQLSSAKILSKVDIVEAFFTIPLDEESALKTTIATPWGCFKMKRLAMGLRNSPQTFQRLITTVLRGVPDLFIYLDDILVFSKSEDDHKKRSDSYLADCRRPGSHWRWTNAFSG